MLTTVSSNILVLGAGELGLAVLQALAKHSATPTRSVTVLLRHSSATDEESPKLKEIRALGIHVLIGDLIADDIPSLAHLFTPYDTIISCTGFVAGSGTQRKLAEAVLQAGVKRYIPWQFGVDYDAIGRGSGQDLFDEQLDVRDMLRGQSKTEWIIISTGMFTSYLFEPSFGVVDLEHSVVHALGSWETEVTLTTPKDIGEMTVLVVLEQPAFRNQVVFVAGETINYSRLAKLVEEQTRKGVKREIWDLDYLGGQLTKNPTDMLAKYRLVFAAGKGVAWDMERTYNYQRGIKLSDVETWLKENSQ